MSELFEPYRQRHEDTLKTLIDSTTIPAARIKQAMQYTLFSGGKRLRPLLIYLCGRITNAPLESMDIMAAAIELIHCYSLIHDDLPAMDNDDFRRGKPSCHRAFDEATAILVGDGMQAFAIELLLTHLPQRLTMTQVVHVTQALVRACGPSGMVSGQSLDLTELSNPDINRQTLETIHTLKTGQLMKACIDMSVHAGTPSVLQTQALYAFSHFFGLVFQMQDDYLDRYDTSLGKGRHSDVANQKQTFASLYDQQSLHDLILLQFEQAHQALNPLGEAANALHELLNTLQCRASLLTEKST